MKPVGVQVGSHHEHTRLVYAEDLGIGQRFDLGSHTVTEAELVDFATHWDPQWFHIDRAAAQDGQFGGLIASGIHTLAILQRLTFDAVGHSWAAIAGRGIRDLRFRRPVRPGDVLTGTVVIDDRHAPELVTVSY